ncbi:sodium:solute symporter family transporter [Pseudohaliea rubra]|uniref:Sodium/iodide co-transporter n=1 Tax=Pseudohaliea rubra DSM 19751 TaxID=1265313 RepID=A0A095VQH6_9GAMM|nr:sodium:solute symporter [Pseudohaliea rubra]KGE03600.1 sodium/iodide co-transporter [Pseudohaliea rubra DSM 19751]
MATLDWWVIGSYLAGMLLLALGLGRHQHSREDYYLAGRGLPNWALATSIIATQCSTNSLLGAPAFVGFAAAGGLLWLQYELAVPLAMLALCFLFAPVHASGVISIYAFLEKRLGPAARLLASGCFLVFRGVATGVTVYGVASVLGLITELSYPVAVCLLMGITIAYDVLGGMRAVVISDMMQMVLLVAAVLFALAWLAEPLLADLDGLAPRLGPLVNDWGLTTGNDYGFWPMLFGGFFLYVAYYGCDQSQAQRLLAARDRQGLERVLVLNGLLRFPLVLAYCLLGLGLAAYATRQPEFLASLPRTADGSANINLVFPAFVSREFAPGFAGLAIVGLFAAAMSSIDSALNSLSAATLEDFIDRGRLRSEEQLFRLSRLVTLAWGAAAVGFSFTVERIAPTVLEAINKVGSMANGPLLALFLLALLVSGARGLPALGGFLVGIGGNIIIALTLPGVSWLWWNVSGLLLALAAALVLTAVQGHPLNLQALRLPGRRSLRWLGAGTASIIAVLGAVQVLSRGLG